MEPSRKNLRHSIRLGRLRNIVPCFALQYKRTPPYPERESNLQYVDILNNVKPNNLTSIQTKNIIKTPAFIRVQQKDSKVSHKSNYVCRSNKAPTTPRGGMRECTSFYFSTKILLLYVS